MDKIIEVKGLSKSFGSVKAVDDISFYVEKGSLFAFLGPNGAGKSTTIDIICTLLKPDSGTVLINGHTLDGDNEAIRREIGVVFQDSVLDKKLTVQENLEVRGRLYGLKGASLKSAIDRAAEAAGCTGFLNRLYGVLSGGERRRTDIARTFLNMPKILFLDEPTTGLDPSTRKAVWQTIRDISTDTGMTVFLTTHYMEEAAGADYVAVIDNGKIAAKGTPSFLRDNYSSDTLSIRPKSGEELAEKLSAMGLKFSRVSDLFIIKLASTLDAVEIAHRLREDIAMLEVKSGSMDDAFISITGGIL